MLVLIGLIMFCVVGFFMHKAEKAKGIIITLVLLLISGSIFVSGMFPIGSYAEPELVNTREITSMDSYDQEVYVVDNDGIYSFSEIVFFC